MANNVKYVDFVLDEGAHRPVKQHTGDAGWDLYTSETCTIAPGETRDVHTGVGMRMPPCLFARITGRSSSLRKHSILVNEGIIDNGYTGELLSALTTSVTNPSQSKGYADSTGSLPRNRRCALERG